MSDLLPRLLPALGAAERLGRLANTLHAHLGEPTADESADLVTLRREVVEVTARAERMVGVLRREIERVGQTAESKAGKP